MEYFLHKIEFTTIFHVVIVTFLYCLHWVERNAMRTDRIQWIYCQIRYSWCLVYRFLWFWTTVHLSLNVTCICVCACAYNNVIYCDQLTGLCEAKQLALKKPQLVASTLAICRQVGEFQKCFISGWTSVHARWSRQFCKTILMVQMKLLKH